MSDLATYTLELTEQEHQALVAILADQPWRIANPIMFKLAQGRGLANYSGPEPDPRAPPTKRPDGRWSMPPARES